MPPIRLGGLASGLDSETLITQLLAAESGGRIRYQRQQDVTEARKSTLNDIQTRLKALGTALADLRAPTLFADTQTVETSDPARVAFTRTGSVGTGAYAVDVLKVASAEQRTFRFDVQGTDSALTIGGHSTTIAANATLADAIAAINSDKDAKVYASDAGDGRIALSWRATGELSPAHPDQAVSGAAFSDDRMLRAGKDAEFSIDGGATIKQASNEYTGLPGLTLTMKAPTTSSVAVTVGPPGPDTQRIADKLKAFVDAYNSANDLMRTELREEKVRDANTKFDRGKGVLRGDPQLTALQGALRQALQTTVATGRTAADQLADLGITTGAAAGEATFSRDAVNGRLVIDDTKLRAAITAEPGAVKQLLGGTGAGIAQAMEAVLSPATGTGGVFEERTKSADSELARIRRSMTAFDERLELREKALRAMFTRLEQSLASSQAQGSQLSSQLARL